MDPLLGVNHSSPSLLPKLVFLSNSTSNSSSLPATGLSISSQVGIAILLLAFLLGFPGNLFVVWTILFRVTRRSVTCLLVLNLAVADALVLLTAPLFLRFLAGGRGWEFGSAVCKLVHYLCCVNMYASIYLICLMSADRWLAVARPFVSQRLRTRRALLCILLGLWTLAFLLALPMPFYRSNIKLEKVPVYICMPYHWRDPRHQVFQYLWETLLGFMLPFAVIVLCYAGVVWRLRSAMFQGRGRGSRLILLIIAAFAVFWAPYHLVNLLQVSGLLGSTAAAQQALNAAKTARPNVTAFAFLSSSVNPVLYVFAGSSHIRRAGLSFMARLFDATCSETTGSTRGSSLRSSSAEMSALRKFSVNLPALGSTRSKDRGWAGGPGQAVGQASVRLQDGEGAGGRCSKNGTAEVKTLITTDEVL
ncbi:leukotriene B4 receptor 1 [Amia ocellicauda]|uniref:leukotriene B4 receptor 1 n=1 Tax=Amia ocellicauda TaxID=2972642 RepID=UPI003463C067